MKTIFLNAICISTLVLFSCKKDNNGKTDENVTNLNSTRTEENINLEEDKRKLDSIDKITKSKMTSIEFDKLEHDFGTITSGDKVETVFKIKNTGKNDLYITSAYGSCGCTVPEVTKDAIKPGTSTSIFVKFDSTNKIGITEKSVTINCNTEKTTEIVKIKANILEKK